MGINFSVSAQGSWQFPVPPPPALCRPGTHEVTTYWRRRPRHAFARQQITGCDKCGLHRPAPVPREDVVRCALMLFFALVIVAALTLLIVSTVTAGVRAGA